jgi:hypothetical protein
LSAFVPVLTFEDRDDILERFVTGAFPAIPGDSGRSWQVIPEFEQPELLGETGEGMPTNVGILLFADDVVVCVESKFRVDALEGFGKCRQATSSSGCRGFYGHGSDAKGGTNALCRLEVPDGQRDPRKYWELGCGGYHLPSWALLRTHVGGAGVSSRCGHRPGSFPRAVPLSARCEN